MPEPVPRLSFGDTSVRSLVSAVRIALPEASLDWEAVASEADQRVEELVRDNTHIVRDLPGEQWLRTCSIVLATYEQLKPSIAGARLLPLFYEAMAAPFRAQIGNYLEARFGITDDAPQEAFARISENFQKRGEERFGLAFRYAADVRDGERHFINIERCFFNEFFRANHAREVTSLFCKLDTVWADVLEQPRYGVRFERPTTLARDGDACRFQFRKSEPDKPSSR